VPSLYKVTCRPFSVIALICAFEILNANSNKKRNKSLIIV
jgi:hypothetical protein